MSFKPSVSGSVEDNRHFYSDPIRHITDGANREGLRAQMKLIALTKGYFAKVSDEDYERINSFNWFANVRSNSTYVRAARMKNRQMIYMHHEVLELHPSQLEGNHVDHENRDPLDNQRHNLIIKTAMGNAQNTERSQKRKGYCFNARSHSWSCYLDMPGKPRKYLGYTATEKEAIARVAKARALEDN